MVSETFEFEDAGEHVSRMEFGINDIIILKDDGKVIFDDRVSQIVMGTGLLRFENSDIGLSEFIDLLHESDEQEVLER